tara:strand:+ start:209 stop:388 length:180 start_codon:yes stop_codon:yes gene_type:complete
MNDENPNIPPCPKYVVNMEKEDLINIYVRKWVLKWCKEYHPEAFVEAEKFIRELADENN